MKGTTVTRRLGQIVRARFAWLYLQRTTREPLGDQETSGELDPLLAAIRDSEMRRADLRQQITALEEAACSPKFDVDAVRGKG